MAGVLFRSSDYYQLCDVRASTESVELRRVLCLLAGWGAGDRGGWQLMSTGSFYVLSEGCAPIRWALRWWGLGVFRLEGGGPTAVTRLGVVGEGKRVDGALAVNLFEAFSGAFWIRGHYYYWSGLFVPADEARVLCDNLGGAVPCYVAYPIAVVALNLPSFRHGLAFPTLSGSSHNQLHLANRAIITLYPLFCHDWNVGGGVLMTENDNVEVKHWTSRQEDQVSVV
ncbi:hypothetical protein Tco_0109621 [Tanacetum coccineum]